jgi:hypothetical protein
VDGGEIVTYTLEVWKEQASQRLHSVGGWLERRAAQDAPYLLYGALCGLTLWPLVEAAQAGQWLPVIMALGSVADGIGGDLIAEQVQRWKDQARDSPVDETHVAEWVVEHAPTDPDLREALDTILERLDAVSQAQVGLSEGERRRFTAAMREELAQLGNLGRFEAALSGSGAMVLGDVHGDVVTGQVSTVFDQRGQQVGRQFNVAGNLVGGDLPGEGGDDEEG